MNIDLIFLSVILLITVFMYFTAKVSIKSNVDGRYYSVKNNSMRQQSADLLANVNKGLLELIEHIKSLDAKPVYYKNLEKYDPNSIHENIIDLDTTYTLDKGRYMAFCLGPRYSDTPMLYDLNTMMYVAVHELAHIASDSIGHTDEFKKNFADLLKKAIDIGVYRYIDYSKESVDYCGIKLTKNILN